MKEISKEQQRKNNERWLIFAVAMVLEMIIHLFVRGMMPTTNYATPLNHVASVLFALSGLAILANCVILVVDCVRREQDVAPIGGTKDQLYISIEILIMDAEQYLCLKTIPEDLYPTALLFIGMMVFIPCVIAGFYAFLMLMDAVTKLLDKDDKPQITPSDFSPGSSTSTATSTAAAITTSTDDSYNPLSHLYHNSYYNDDDDDFDNDKDFDDFDDDDDEYDDDPAYRREYSFEEDDDGALYGGHYTYDWFDDDDY